MKKSIALFSCAALLTSCINTEKQTWTIDTQAEWQEQQAQQTNLKIENGFAEPQAKEATFISKMKTFSAKQSATTITLDQSPVWDNWKASKNIGPINLQDAPVFLTIGPNNYWIFGRYGKARLKKQFKPQSITIDGYDVELQTTPFKNQYNAPGGLKPSKGGYHAWQSKDMKNWIHHGPVTEGFSKWVTTAEYVDGKAYIYYDYPNDMDPHLYIDEDLTDGKPGKNMGLAFADPSHGSDCAFIRDEEGNFHVIYEDWSPIDASRNAWDSPLAGHAVSKDGIKDFKILPPVIDHRTKPTGKKATYRLHPNQHPKSYKGSPNPFRLPAEYYETATYNVHTPAQNAYGDWASINIGGRYYLFGDFDKAGHKTMSVARFTANSLNEQFEFCGSLGKGHPDPEIAFADGKFQLLTQQPTDFTSPGPWVETVEVRVGVDTNSDGRVNQWSKWQTVKESYDYKPGFSKHVLKTAAKLDLSDLPSGHGFQFELKMTDTTENKSKPILDKVTLEFN